MQADCLSIRDNGDFKLGSFKFSETRDIIPRLFSGLVDGAERVRGIVNMLKEFAHHQSDHELADLTDEGEGMSADVLRHLTDPFFTTGGDSVGTGLGLSISSAILRKNRGAISFASEPGRGTTALVELSTFPNQP